MSGKRIILWILIFIVVVAITVFAGFKIFANKSNKLKNLQSELAQKIAPAKDKLLRMCPQGYDTKRLSRAFDDYIEYARRGQVKVKYVQQNLVPYLLFAVQDGRLTSQEADSLTSLFEMAVKTTK